MKNLISILFILFVSSPHALATNWIEVADSMYIDADSIELYNPQDSNKDKMYSYWVKYYNNGTVHWQNYSKVTGKEILFSIGMQIINCEQKTATTKTTIDYDKDNLPLFRNDTLDYLLKWKHIAPGTLGEDMYQVLCSQ